MTKKMKFNKFFKQDDEQEVLTAEEVAEELAEEEVMESPEEELLEEEVVEEPLVVEEEPVIEEELVEEEEELPVEEVTEEVEEAVVPSSGVIRLARYYNLKLDGADLELASGSEWKLFIDDSYTKHIYNAVGVTIQELLGLDTFAIKFKNGDDLDFRRDNLVLTQK
jgi:hypothetical protein